MYASRVWLLSLRRLCAACLAAELTGTALFWPSPSRHSVMRGGWWRPRDIWAQKTGTAEGWKGTTTSSQCISESCQTKVEFMLNTEIVCVVIYQAIFVMNPLTTQHGQCQDDRQSLRRFGTADDEWVYRVLLNERSAWVSFYTNQTWYSMQTDMFASPLTSSFCLRLFSAVKGSFSRQISVSAFPLNVCSACKLNTQLMQMTRSANAGVLNKKVNQIAF